MNADTAMFRGTYYRAAFGRNKAEGLWWPIFMDISKPLGSVGRFHGNKLKNQGRPIFIDINKVVGNTGRIVFIDINKVAGNTGAGIFYTTNKLLGKSGRQHSKQDQNILDNRCPAPETMVMTQKTAARPLWSQLTDRQQIWRHKK